MLGRRRIASVLAALDPNTSILAAFTYFHMIAMDIRHSAIGANTHVILILCSHIYRSSIPKRIIPNAHPVDVLSQETIMPQ